MASILPLVLSARLYLYFNCTQLLFGALSKPGPRNTCTCWYSGILRRWCIGRTPVRPAAAPVMVLLRPGRGWALPTTADFS